MRRHQLEEIAVLADEANIPLVRELDRRCVNMAYNMPLAEAFVRAIGCVAASECGRCVTIPRKNRGGKRKGQSVGNRTLCIETIKSLRVVEMKDFNQ